MNWMYTIVRKLNQDGHIKMRQLRAEEAQLRLEIAQKAARIRDIRKELKYAPQTHT